MSTIAEKLAGLQKQAASNQDHLAALRVQLDDAADAADVQEIAAIQAEITARDGMVASYERRMAKLQAELGDEARAKRSAANLECVGRVKAELSAAAACAIDLDKTLAQLVDQLEAIHKHGAAASLAADEVTRQLPKGQRERYRNVVDAVGFRDGLLGVVLEGQLQRSGVFTTLAPLATISLKGHSNLGSVAETIASRADKMTAALASLAERVNQEA